ncbi:trypsin [Saccharopolyspora erythraea NRRL 2338]|uniref:Secreted trypsin-like serine protease n=2 Tax=Saccharopolyspora erythraea TaxID=1836 RepID=A4FM78_SACEN|nr:trypsin [Saccharopolyspora erythraea D]PFG98790.1 trypsin [Saccharopolyspora erythraea NRRL 2338]QRK88791.1 serine protease [Saccharopolyspora erythraea]CAM05153.1 secreted trypsin-like serine protease [Saccharopolyspora erythraea NRRL 2338]
MARMSRRTWPFLGVAGAVALSSALLSPAAAGPATGPPVLQAPPIVGGQPASIAEHPWMVYLTDAQGNQLCGGALAAPNKVVTAGHCVLGEKPEGVQVVAGRERLDGKDGTVAKVTGIWVHPKYQDASSGSDVAVLTLDQRLPQPPLPVASQQDTALYQPGTPSTVLGWGKTAENGQSSNELRRGELQVLADEECTKAYKEQYKADSMTCAGVPGGGVDACQGDSGGPLVAGDRLIGLVSWGDGCARPESPGVYTRIAALHDDIQAQLGS